MKKGTYLPVLVWGIISLLMGLFYLSYINLSTDTIILFISQKIFLGKWLAKGVIPFYNPHIYAGIPFLFDPGMGNLHPFNLFFIFPFPYSFALWTAVTTFLFLTGFYLLFRTFSKNVLLNTVLTLAVFFSGSGFWRTNNPAISLVIAHYGLFIYAAGRFQKKGFNWLFLLTGFFMTISGHIQFVFYGYIIAFLTGWLFYKVPLKKLIAHFALLGVLTSWFYVLCLPIVLSSTRLTTHKDYTNMGPLHPLQLIQFIFPLFFGYVQNGSKWNAGPTFVILISILFAPAVFYLFLKRKINKGILFVFAVFAAATLGLINFPFFRGAAQSIIVIHILGLILIAKHGEILVKGLRNLNKMFIVCGFLMSVLALIFFKGGFFSTFFFLLYHAVKKAPSLFYDEATVRAIGSIIGLNFILLGVLFADLFFAKKFIKYALHFLLAFVVFEGVFINYFHNYFVPVKVITKQASLPKGIDAVNYRIQTGADVIPYFGFHNYISEVLFRPPFSKEPTSFDAREQRTFEKLQTIFSYYPSSWAMTANLYALQGYNTFVTHKIAQYFKSPSADYKKVYGYIIERNALYGQSEIGLDINGIETSKITLYDPRWQELGVRYFITDRPLASYKLMKNEGEKYYYENEKAPPIYSIPPSSIDPNKMEFNIKKGFLGKKLVIIINPDGFVARLNGKAVPFEKKGFRMSIPLTGEGVLEVYYSPLSHLLETLHF